MGGQLAYLYLVGPISMEDGRPITLPDIPLLGTLTIIMMVAGSLIMAAILQRKPLPITYVAVNKEPLTKISQEEEEENSKQQYRPIYPGQFSKNAGEAYYNKGDNSEDLNWGSGDEVPRSIEKKLGSFTKRELQLPSSGFLFFSFLLALAIGLVALGERGPFIYLFPIAFLVAFTFPGLIWISYVYDRSIKSPEPQRLVLIALAWGMFSTLPASILNDLGGRLVDVNQNALLGNGDFGNAEIILVSVIAPIVEELLKPIGLIFVIKRLRTPYEGVLYGVACGMGFAIMENLLYELFILIWYGADAWTINAFVRGIGSTVLHAVGPAAVGYAYALSNQMKISQSKTLGIAILFGIIMHGLWNGFATLPFMMGEETTIVYFSYFLIALMIVICLTFIIKALEYGKEYSYMELEAASFDDLEEATNSGH